MTANYALEQGRDLFAVPGNVNSKSSGGVNGLLKDSAKIVTSVTDILEDYGKIYPQLIKPVGFTTNEIEFDFPTGGYEEINIEKTIKTCLAERPARIDELAVKTGLSAGQLNGVITMMELTGKVEQDKFGDYRLTD